MTTNSNEQLQRSWRSGVLLTNSWLTFAESELREKWKAAHEVSAITQFQSDMDAAKDAGNSGTDAVMAIMSGASKILRNRAEIETQLKENILRYTKKGLLVGFGFEPPRRLKSFPVRIPISMWNQKCDWNASTLAGQGMEFVEIRLITPKAIEKIEVANTGAFVSKPKSRGRPTIKPQIAQAFDTLQQAEKIDAKSSVMHISGQVRQQLAISFPELKVSDIKPSHEAIRRVIAPLLKRNTKQ